MECIWDVCMRVWCMYTLWLACSSPPTHSMPFLDDRGACLYSPPMFVVIKESVAARVIRVQKHHHKALKPELDPRTQWKQTAPESCLWPSHPSNFPLAQDGPLPLSLLDISAFQLSRSRQSRAWIPSFTARYHVLCYHFAGIWISPKCPASSWWAWVQGKTLEEREVSLLFDPCLALYKISQVHMYL